MSETPAPDADGTLQDPGGLGARIATSIADVTALPTSLRAVLDYYATTGELAVGVVGHQRRVDAYVERVIDEAFDPVERAIADEAGVDPGAVTFAYDTKLTMPAELTLGHLYQRAAEDSPAGVYQVAGTRRRSVSVLRSLIGGGHGGDDREERIRNGIEAVERAESVTELVVVALLDGDMRDAINDDEYEDFLVDGAGGMDRPRAAAIAQRILRERVDELFDAFPPAVRGAYREAVDRSEAHQDRDPYFRDLMAAARDGDGDALEAIREEYKFGAFSEREAEISVDDRTEGDDERIRPAELFLDAERSFPYLKTQYGRVGVIYDGMIEMYRAAGIPIEDAFKRSIVFTIIGAQIWLDDIDDYPDDLAEDQLTPVTAEYLLADSDREAYRAIVDATNEYLDAAERYAAATNSPLAGIGTNYVFRSGDPSVLPGHE